MDPKRSPHPGGAAGAGGTGGAAGGPRAPGAPGRPRAAAPGQAAGPAAAAAAQAGARLGQQKAPQATASEALDRLAADVRQLRIDFERFFSGALPLPPEDLRRRVQAQLRNLRNMSALTAVERFRLGDLEARHNSYDELFSRRLRDREEGRRRTGPHAAVPAPAAARRGVPGYDPAAGIVIGEHPDPRAVAALYEGLTTAGAPPGGAADRGGAPPQEGAPPGAPRFDLATFGAYLERQAAAIRAKTGCAEVQFRLAADDGKLKLKARPMPATRATIGKPGAAGEPGEAGRVGGPGSPGGPEAAGSPGAAGSFGRS